MIYECTLFNLIQFVVAGMVLMQFINLWINDDDD